VASPALPSPLAPHLHDSQKLCEQARALREAVRITVAKSKEAAARSHRIAALIKQQKKSTIRE